jgi:multicomponent Na+:H+ antiporter subunit D
MGGSWSKWYLLLGAIEADQLVFVVVLLVSSLLSIAYLMPVVARAFFLAPDPDEHHHGDPDGGGEGFFANMHEAPLLCVAPLCLTALGCIALFFYAPDIYDLLKVITVER